MRYNYQGERYNLNSKNNYNINSYIPNWRKNLKLSSDIYGVYNINNNPKLPMSLKLPRLHTNLSNQILNPLFNSYQYDNPYNYYYKGIYNNNNLHSNSIIPNYNPPNTKLVMGLPVIVHKAKKYKIKNFTPAMTKSNLYKNYQINNENRMRKNISNLVVSSIIQETINTPRLNSPEDIFKNHHKKRKKNKNYERFMKKVKTEQDLEKDIKPFFTTEMKIKPYKKWWYLLKYFTTVYYYFSVLKKYTNKIKVIRAKEINDIEENLVDEVNKVRNWIIELQGKFWSNLIKYKNISTSFTEDDSIDKIHRISKVFLELIDQYLYNLKIQTNDIEQIPEDVQKIIYRFIKKNAYFPSKYLNLFHIKRLIFDFYGSCLNNTLEYSAMLLCYLLISSISVQQILLNIKFIFKQLKPYENISITAKYMASILYYLERDAFVGEIKLKDIYLNITNYYKCYHLSNFIIDNEKNIKILLGIKKDTKINIDNEDINNDIYNKLLIDDKIIEKFWENNFKVMKKFSSSLFLWSRNLARLILNKYEKKEKK